MELIPMQLLPLFIGSSTALGIGCFCLDLYRNRRRLSTKPNLTIDLVCYDPLPSPDGDDLQAVGQAVSHVSHAVGDASHCASNGVGHCVEAIAHALSHH